MTDAEILAKAAEIKTRHAAAKRGRDIFTAPKVEIVAWGSDGQPNDRIILNASAELSALLCMELGVTLSEGVDDD